MDTLTLNLSTTTSKPYQQLQTILIKSPISLSNSQIYCLCYKRSLSSTIITCKFKTTKQNRESKSVAKKIVVSDVPPPLSEDGGAARNGGAPPSPDRNNTAGGLTLKLLKKLQRRVLGVLSNLPLAIGEMASIAALMALAVLLSVANPLEFPKP